MRIAFVITNAPPLIGGLEKICLRLAQMMQSRGHEVRIVARFTQGRHSLKGYFLNQESPGTFVHEGIQIRVLSVNRISRLLLFPVFRLIWRKWTFPIASFLYVCSMRSQLVEEFGNSEIVHFFGNGPEMLGFAAEQAARKSRAKFIVEPALHEGQWGDSWTDKKLYGKADLLLAHTHHEESVLLGMGLKRDKITVVTHGFDPGSDGDGSRFRKLHRLNGPVVLFLGRKTKEKGVERLIRSWPLVLQKHPDAMLVLAGAGQGKEINELPPSSIDLDDLSESSKQDALAACDLLCVPSAGESFGMVYFEAWAYKKPVVGLDLPVLRETIGRSGGGILVNDDPDALAAAMNALLSDPKRCASMGEAGKVFSINYHWNKAIKSYSDAYEM